MRKSHMGLMFGMFLLGAAAAPAAAPRTMRLDYFHTGNAADETFSLDRVVLEPLHHAFRGLDTVFTELRRHDP